MEITANFFHNINQLQYVDKDFRFNIDSGQIHRRFIRKMQKNDTDPKFCAGAVELYLWTIFRSYGVIDTTHRNETQVIPQVIRYITEHFSEPLTLEDIAAEFFVSKSYLNRHFKAYTNSTVYAYIMALRLTHARRMLREGIPAVEAGRECGFSDYSTFYKAFKTQTGLSPQQFKSRA